MTSFEPSIDFDMYALTPYPITPIGNFVGVVLALLPLISQLRKFSLAVWGYALWIATYNFIFFMNTIIWRNNANIVASANVWCDITSKLQIGTGVGTRACAFVICVHLYRITRLRASPNNTNKGQRWKVAIYELIFILLLPVVVMALYIIVQPFRFEILQEEGCIVPSYSYVTYIIYFVPEVILSIGCIILAPLTLSSFLRHRKEINENITARNNEEITRNKYKRLMVIACLDTVFNMPELIVAIVTDVLQGKNLSLNYSYVSWKNVHDGAGGLLPGGLLSTILQTPASEWSTGGAWSVFQVKWDEWVYVLHAVVFFGVFGTTPEMRQYYWSALWFLPERCGYKRPPVSEVGTMSDVAFNSNPEPQMQIQKGPTGRRRGSLSFLETTIGTNGSRLVGLGDDNGVGVISSHHASQTISSVAGDQSQTSGRN